MKFETSRDALLRPLRIVTGVVERRPTLAVLSNLYVEADADGLTIRGTDLEVEIVVRLTEGVEVKQPGATTMPAHKLADIWQSLPETAVVSVALEEHRAIVRSGRSRFALATIPAADFPSERPLLDIAENTAEPEGVKLDLPHADLRLLFDRTKFAMANGDVRYFLNGMLLEVTASSFRAAASDGHRMAMCTLEGSGVEGVDQLRVIVPRKSVLDLERLIGDSDEDVHLVLGAKSLCATQGDYTLTTKLVDGEFPDVDRLIPRNLDHSIVGDREFMRQALHRAAILSNEKSQDVRLQLDGDQMTIRATNPEQEEAEEVVSVEYDGNPAEVGFNVRYLQDVIAALETESIKFSMPEANNIAVMEGLGAEDALYLVMPLRR